MAHESAEHYGSKQPWRLCDQGGDGKLARRYVHSDPVESESTEMVAASISVDLLDLSFSDLMS
jgi:hypothetical protein